ncbi:MAG: prepilin-type N-terminal cleavage/methylation domain-containing protein [Kiritimatiellae bacterium]|nr:prepilin-type N-terminal cleavage/methylation domain-containing protein [Kiritimatiellia bacterium]
MKRRGFTLIEVLVTIVLVAIAFTIIGRTFVAIKQAWQFGTAAVEELHHGDFVSEQVEAALRSATYVQANTSGSLYGFLHEDGSGTYPEDRISWVTSARAFIAPTSHLARTTHRIELSIETDRDAGGEALMARAWSHLQRDMDRDEVDPWLVSPLVRGLDCRFWNAEREEFEDDWENTNRLPDRVEIALYFDPPEGTYEPLIMRRLVDIPASGVATSRLQNTRRRQR